MKNATGTKILPSLRLGFHTRNVKQPHASVGMGTIARIRVESVETSIQI
jgi:hypothetical protein